jgi:hypothetical protein
MAEFEADVAQIVPSYFEYSPNRYESLVVKELAEAVTDCEVSQRRWLGTPSILVDAHKQLRKSGTLTCSAPAAEYAAKSAFPTGTPWTRS